MTRNDFPRRAAGVAVMAALAAGAAAVVAGRGGNSTAAADAATTTTARAPATAYPGTPAGQPPRGAYAPGAQVTGAAADRAKAAALAKYPGTVERVLKNPAGGYVVHVIRRDGTEVHVLVSASFQVTGTEVGPPGGSGGRPPWGGQGPPAPVTGAAAERAKAAALAKYPGTVERVLKNPAGGYVVHVIRKDGTEVHVLVNSAFQVTGVAPAGHPPGAWEPPSGMAPGTGRHAWGAGAPPATAPPTGPRGSSSSSRAGTTSAD